MTDAAAAGAATDEVVARLNRLSRRLAKVEELVPTVRGHDRDLARIGPQVAALEERMEALRLAADAPVVDERDVPEARSLLAEVRRLHQQVRVRVTSLVRYEERIRQLEERLGEEPPPR